MIEKIILKKSAVENKIPTTEQLEYGEIALNFNTMNPFISFKDTADGIRQIKDYSNEIQNINGSLTDAKNEINYLRPLVTDNHTNLMFLRSDFEDFKEDNTKTINVLDRNVSQNGSDIQNNTTAIATLSTSVDKKVDKTDITQSTGTSTTSVMSQKAVSDALSTKVDKTDITQSTGTSETEIMSQKAVSDALSTKVDKSDITQSTGTSTTSVMSQKASTDSFIANTPSGDPAHFLYESAGAKWNADTGLWTLGSYSDLTTEEIRYAFANKITYLGAGIGVFHDYDCRCMFPLRIYGIGSPLIVNRWLYNSKIREFMTDTMNLTGNINKPMSIQLTGNSAYAFSSKNIVRISSEIGFTSDIWESLRNTIFSGCVKLEYIRVNSTSFGLYLNDSPLLSKESVLSMINGSDNSNTVTHTLHPDVYAKCVDGGEWSAEIQTALANKTNVSLAKAE